MAPKQSDSEMRAAAQSLVVLTGDTALGDRLREIAAQRPHEPIDIILAPDPEAARAALAAHGPQTVVLCDLRRQLDPVRHLPTALSVLQRHGAVVALIEDHGNAAAMAARDAGATELVAESELTPALLASVIQHAANRREYEQRLKKLRLHEPVIGIPSQALFWEILLLAARRAKRNRDFFAVMLLDIDNLPDGDSLEGPYRDLALRDLVARIQPILRGSDTVARLETQQLAILAESMPRVEDIQIVAEKIIEEAERPLEIGSGPVALDVAIGIALFPTSADNAEDMVARATDAMLQARERGRNRFAFA